MSTPVEGRGRSFFKMTGSGNDFIFFDARGDEALSAALGENTSTIRRLCARGTGVGADGVVFLTASDRADIGLRYNNSDGSLASLCGNATLCAASLGVGLGAVKAEGFTIETDAGVIAGRIREGRPEVDFGSVRDPALSLAEPLKRDGESALGFVVAGVPHLVVRVPDVEALDVERRGRELRRASALGPDGANVNFVSRAARDGWRMRTYERGVEGETLACGTGCVATAVLLASWGEIADQVELLTRSGERMEVRLRRDPDSADGWLPSLRGEGRLVFSGELPAG